MQPTPMKQNLEWQREEQRDWRRVTGKKDYYKNQMGKWTVCFYSFHLLSLEWSSANLWGCKFWGEPPITPFTWISCTADLCNLFSQFMFCILPPPLTPARFSFCLLLPPRWSFKKIGFKLPSVSTWVGVLGLSDQLLSPWPTLQVEFLPFLFHISQRRAKVSAICVCTTRAHT